MFLSKNFPTKNYYAFDPTSWKKQGKKKKLNTCSEIGGQNRQITKVEVVQLHWAIGTGRPPSNIECSTKTTKRKSDGSLNIPRQQKARGKSVTPFSPNGGKLRSLKSF